MDFNIESRSTQMGSFRGCTCLKCTNKARCTPTEQIDAPTEQDRFFQEVHLSPLGFAACQSKKCTNKAIKCNNKAD